MLPQEMKASQVPKSPVEDDAPVDMAFGSVEERRPYTLATFYRSVLFQMVLFGA